MDPETYFASLEPDLSRREKLIEQLKHALTPRIDKKAVVVVTGPKCSGKSTLIGMLMSIYPSKSVSVDISDICRTWRSFEVAKICLQFILLPHQQCTTSTIPMFTEGFHPYNLDKYGVPRFRYLIEDHEPAVYLDTYVIHIALTQTFPQVNVRLDYKKFRSYLTGVYEEK